MKRLNTLTFRMRQAAQEVMGRGFDGLSLQSRWLSLSVSGDGVELGLGFNVKVVRAESVDTGAISRFNFA